MSMNKTMNSRNWIKEKIDEIATIKPFAVLFDLSFYSGVLCVDGSKKENIGNRNGFWEDRKYIEQGNYQRIICIKKIFGTRKCRYS